MEDERGRETGPSYDLGHGSALQVAAQWTAGEGRALRVVRWQLQGSMRQLYHWARGAGFAAGPGDEDGAIGAERWAAGVALEQQDVPGGRWNTLQRQELTGADPARFRARLDGWEAGLIDRAERLARKWARRALPDQGG